MNDVALYGLTWLLLPSAIPAVGAAALSRSRPRLTDGRGVIVAQPDVMPTDGRTSQIVHENFVGAKYDGSSGKYEDVATPIFTNGHLHQEVFDEQDDKDRLKRQPSSDAPTTTPKGMRSPAPPQDAVVETRPDLIHPPFTTYLFSVTVPCVLAWVIVTWLCLWVCRPHSPLYREILKRLIEHSQMKQKSVLFAATVLAGERKPPEENAEAAEATAAPSTAEPSQQK